LITGYGSDDADGRRFNPDKPVTMEQLAMVLANAFESGTLDRRA
jgi:hypothetical protein